MDEKIIVGLMSGTSVDGVDVCLIKIKENFDFEFLGGLTNPYSENLSKKIKNLFNFEVNLKEICEINVILGEFYVKSIQKLCKKLQISPQKIDLISSHGQTVYHNPTKEKFEQMSLNSTMQLGELSVIAKKLGVLTIGDFRPCDMAQNGQGAPLVPFFDNLFFTKDEKLRAIQNIGGISNVTVVGKNIEPIAFDTGAGNCLIDFFCKEFFNKNYDKNGEIALSGKIDNIFLNLLMKNDFFKKKPPKSTGRELFSYDYAKKILKFAPSDKKNLIATITAFTAHSIKDQYERFILPKFNISDLVLCGGGAKNLAIIKFLKKEFANTNIKIKKSKDFGLSSDFKEAIAFAFLGYACFMKIPNNICSATGAKKPTIMGKIVYP